MPPAYTDLHLYRRLLWEARPYWAHITLFFLISMLSSPLTLLTPVPLKIVVDSVIGTHPLPGFIDRMLPGFMTGSNTSILLFAAILMVAVVMVKQLQQLGMSLTKTYAGEKMVLGFRARIFRHVQRLSLAYHDSKGTSDSTYRIQYDANSVSSVAIDGVIPFFTSGFTLVSMVIVIIAIDWQLAAVALAISPVLLVLAGTYRRRLRPRYRAVKRIESSAMAVVQEVLTSLRVVKAFSQEEREEERFVRRYGEGVRARIWLTAAEGAFGLVIGVLIAAGTASVMYIGARHVQSGSITLGELLLVMGYLSQLYDPLRTISKKITSVQSSLASAERAFTVLDERPEVGERPGARSLVRASGRIAFDDVSFAYVADHPVLQHISFDAYPGARVGIVGPTGAGKTTLVNLLTRFYDPLSGRILLDNVDLRDYKLADLRNQFGIVLQEPVLFSTTIAENIAYASPDAGFEEIVAAAKAASAHDFIAGLPEGYDTLVGERGMRLSGGERQRISLARAFLKDAPILILDEPTSSVDMDTESSIIEAMGRLMEGRTTFMIAHRLTTLRNCDLWLELDEGGLKKLGYGPPPAASRLAPSAGAPVHPDGNGRRRKAPFAITAGVAQHPASQAWLGLTAGGKPPASIEVLKSSKKVLVCRLHGAGPSGKNVIAKRQRRVELASERTLYEEIIPHLPVTATRYYGHFQDDANDSDWIFLEDAGGEPFSLQSEQHRRLAARWLARLHTSAPGIASLAGLPDRGPAHYFKHTVSARSRLLQARQNPALAGEDLLYLEELESLLREVEYAWNWMAELWRDAPDTLVHGDFVPKNIRVRSDANGSVLMPFDWETAGRGIPAPDLARIDEAAYLGFAREAWPGLEQAAVHRLARLGMLFRLLASISWETRRLAYQHVDKPMNNLRLFGDRLSTTLAEVRALAERRR
jgi:ATP-binding cassette subfamily B protein